MEWNVSLILFILLIVTFFLLYKANKKKKELEEEQSNQFLNYYNQHINEIEEKFNQRKDELFREYEDKRKEYQEKLDSISVLIQTKEELLQSEQDKVDRVLSERKKVVDSEVQRYKESLINLARNADKARREEYAADFSNWINQKQIEKEQIEKEQLKILAELEDFRKRRAAINEAILREKEIKEKEDFYRVILTENDLSDMRILEGIAPQMKNRDIIPKLIWDTILRRPVQEMIKRVTGGKDISGIYKITYIKTGEAYIGKTTDIKTRWQNHCKTAIG
ncbi:MAG: GIY-YIG nuclease family protein, partial [Clostridia bacterium]